MSSRVPGAKFYQETLLHRPPDCMGDRANYLARSPKPFHKAYPDFSLFFPKKPFIFSDFHIIIPIYGV